VFIRDELEMMKSFLKTADRDRVRSSVVRTWVMQVRDLSYHAEDSIEGILELEPQRPWWALPFLPRVLPPCCRPRVGRALDEEVDKIKLIKARVEEVSQRNLRYNLINAIGSGQSQQQAPILAMDLDLAKVQEGSFRLRCLLGYLARHGGLSVISVWGTGGNLGTISIIRNMFDHQSICNTYKCRAWVKLMHPFIPQKFLGDLIAQLLLTNSGFTCGDGVMRSKKVEDLVKEVEQLVMHGPRVPLGPGGPVQHGGLVPHQDIPARSQREWWLRYCGNSTSTDRKTVHWAAPECTGAGGRSAVSSR
jgi:hypothetical protein